MGTWEDGHKYGQPHSPITIPTLAPLAFRPWGSPTTKLDIQLDILPRKRIGWPGAAVWADCVRVLDPATLPAELLVTARSTDDDVVMGLRHATLPMEGVQFHPESVLTLDGPHLLANFLRLAGEGDAGVLDDASGSFATKGLAAAPTVGATS